MSAVDSQPENEVKFRFNEYQPTLLITAALDGLSQMVSDEPWSEAATCFGRANLTVVSQLLAKRESEIVEIFQAAKFSGAAAAAALLALACKLSWAQPPAREMDGAALQRDIENGRKNSQVLSRVPRTCKYDGPAKIRIVQLLNATLSDLGPIPSGSVVGYTIRSKIGARLVTVGNLILSDGSQRHNLDYDTRDWVARYLDRYFPDDKGVDGYVEYLKSRWRNLRGGILHLPPEILDSQENMEYFNLVDLKGKGKCVREGSSFPGASHFGDVADFIARVRSAQSPRHNHATATCMHKPCTCMHKPCISRRHP